MKFLAESDSGSHTLLPSHEESTGCAPQKNYGMYRSGTFPHDSNQRSAPHGRQYPCELHNAPGHRDTFSPLPSVAAYPLDNQRLRFSDGNGVDVISAEYCALYRLSASPGRNSALILPCFDLVAIWSQRPFCPALFSGL